MDSIKELEMWKNSIAEEDLSELESYDFDTLRDSFSKFVDFGTGGMRGLIGIGPNRINKYVVTRLSYALLEYLKSIGENQSPIVIIGYDCRVNSKDLALSVARVLTDNGIRTTLFDADIITPLLAYSVKTSSASLGIMITASHNSKEYNGIKIYEKNGVQATTDTTRKISYLYRNIENSKLFCIPELNEAFLDRNVLSIYNRYYTDVINSVNQFLHNKNSVKECFEGVNITYSPLNGSAGRFVARVADLIGLSTIEYLKSEFEPDGLFPGLEAPNPELSSVYNKLILQATLNHSDLAICTDADGDRLGIAVNHEGSFILLSGNQLAALITDYILSNYHSSDIRGKRIFKTVVTTRLVDAIASDYNVSVTNTLTGFKNIGAAIDNLESEDDFLLGVEESAGYLINNYVLDKDGISALYLVLAMASEYKRQGKTLIDRLNTIYEKYGAYTDRQNSLEIDERIRIKIDILRKKLTEGSIVVIGKDTIESVIDYENLVKYNNNGDLIQMEPEFKTNLLIIELMSGSWIAIRPSGTEPKIKIYSEMVRRANISNNTDPTVGSMLANELLSLIEGCGD